MSDEPLVEQPVIEPLFFEPGASWLWLLSGPVAGALMLWIQISSGLGPQPLVPLVFLVLVTVFVAMQVKAARVHTSVELTDETLRQGAETIPVGWVLQVLPEADPKEDPPAWQSSRALGELSGVPKRRKAIGLKLTGKRTVQAWARGHRELRGALITLLEQRDSDVAS